MEAPLACTSTPARCLLQPLYFGASPDADFAAQLDHLQRLLGDLAEFLPPLPLGATPGPCDAVLFPQMLGAAYRSVEALRALSLPRLVITSEFATMAMWDWEILRYLRDEGVSMLAPYNLAQARALCRALSVRRELRSTRFLVFQDNPGEGFQAPIFKRFYWWEDECTQRLLDRFGLTLERRSFRALGAEAKAIPDAEADAVLAARPIPATGLAPSALRSAAKLYLALQRHLGPAGAFAAAGINCLNESHFSDTTPCLAWNYLFEDRGLLWGCEADTVSMLTKFILHRALDVPLFMTNLYPFLMGQAALKHEKISAFPAVDAEPENHVLIAHCGYMGVIPRPFATGWKLNSKVLAIVDANAHAIDALFPAGPITLAKLLPGMTSLSVAQGALTGYAQFPGSDCVNGGVLRLPSGHRLMRNLASHHYICLAGHRLAEIELVAQIFGLNLETL